jgi:hypothetical protein
LQGSEKGRVVTIAVVPLWPEKFSVKTTQEYLPRLTNLRDINKI